MTDATTDVATLLEAWSKGDTGAAEALMPAVYDELHRSAARLMRGERSGHTLSATALLHEAYLKLLRNRQPWQGRGHFINVATKYMREVLIEHARRRHARKRRTVSEVSQKFQKPEVDLIEVDEALQRLESLDPDLARLVSMRFFAGLTLEEVATEMNCSLAKVKLEWSAAKAFLSHELTARARSTP